MMAMWCYALLLMTVHRFSSSASPSRLSDPGSKKELVHVCCYRNAFGWTPDHLDPYICTHITFSFADVRGNELVPRRTRDPHYYRMLNDLKKIKPSLKTILSVSGAMKTRGHDPGMSQMVSCEANRTMFIKQALSFLRKYDFDGVDIDWEFPKKEERVNFRRFLSEFSYAMKDEAKQSGKEKLTFIVSVVSTEPGISTFYVTDQIAKYVDYLNIMSYDYMRWTEKDPYTAYQAALFSRRDQIGYRSTINAAFSGAYWETVGKFPKDKILLGIPTYGRSYKLANESDNGFRAPAVSKGVLGGRVSYTYVCKVLKEGGTRVFDYQSQTPYAYEGLDWFCYEDVQSATAKAKYIRDQGYAGTQVWVADLDDPTGSCGQKFPINKAIARILNPH